MKPFKIAISIVAATTLLLASPLSAEEAVKVEGKMFSNPAAELEATATKLHLDPALLPVLESRGSFNTAERVLPALTANEINLLKQESNSNEKGLRVGIGREIPDSFGETSDWQWVVVAGGKVAHLSVTSTGAVRVRTQLQFGVLPEGVELRFFSPAESATVYGPFTRSDMANQPKDTTGNTLFWSPSVSGDTLKMEVFLPDNVQPSDLNLRIPQLSHVVLDPMSGKTQAGILEANTASCFVDAACLTPEWQQIGRSVGGYFFNQDNGVEGFCSGVLVNTTVGNRVPYMLTANHCVDSAAEAASMDFRWQYINSACGSNDATQRSLASFGAKILATTTEMDTTLVQLNDYPPGESYFSGWSISALMPQDQVGSIHHPGLDTGIKTSLSLNDIGAKSYAQGYFQGFRDIIDDQPYPNSAGKFAAVQWTHSATAKGSSGAGLWAIQKDGLYLKGLLWGGFSSCSNPSGFDYYGRLDMAYPMLKPWLDPAR